VSDKINNGGISGRIPTGLIRDALAAATDGATIDQHGRPYAGNGILVALPADEQTSYVFNWGPALFDHLRGGRKTADDVLELFVKFNQHVVTAPSLRPRYFGAWIEAGAGELPDGTPCDKIHLDIVEAFTQDDRVHAVHAGQVRNQISIWDAQNGREIPTGGTGTEDPTCAGCDQPVGAQHVDCSLTGTVTKIDVA